MIDLLFLYGLKRREFVNQFMDNDSLRNQAEAFWAALTSNSLFFVLVPIILALIFTLFYYLILCNSPQRKYYQPIWWVVTVVPVAVLTPFVTDFVLGFFAPCHLNAAEAIYNRIALINIGFSVFMYVIWSVIFCNSKIKTNAYRLLKF